MSGKHNRTRPRRTHPLNNGPNHPPCGRCGERHDGPCAPAAHWLHDEIDHDDPEATR